MKADNHKFNVKRVDCAEWLPGLRAEFELTSFDALIGSLVVGRSDVVISAFVEQPQRLHEAHFTQPYFNSGTVLVIPGSNVAFNASGALKWAQDRAIAVEYGPSAG